MLSLLIHAVTHRIMVANYAWLFLICLGSAKYAAGQNPEHELEAASPAAEPVIPIQPPANLAQDLKDLYALIDFKGINQLLERYLINDAQFQAFVRIINSNPGHTARWRLFSQPEISLFRQWVNQQLLASSGKFKVKEMELCMSLENRFPYWSGTVHGWQGFLNELELYAPQYAIQATVQTKVQQQGVFAQFWARLQSLQVVYERWLAMPVTQTFLGQLQAAGIDKAHLDTTVRELFGWYATNGTAMATSVTDVPPPSLVSA